MKKNPEAKRKLFVRIMAVALAALMVGTVLLSIFSSFW